MSFLEKNVAEFEVEIKGFETQSFYAQINAKTRDLTVITNAVKIVDEIYPQKFGPHGTHYYSFSQREHFLNLLLRYFDRNTTLPDPVGLQKLQIICNKKAYHQRDADLIRKKKKSIISSKSNLNSKLNWLHLSICLLQAVQKNAYKIAFENRSLDQPIQKQIELNK
jgi:hypothetical protein